MDKQISFSQLSKRLTQIRKTGQPLVLVGGCFDILHYGHVKFLEAAKKHGTLLVALESDANVIRRKGMSRPIHKETQRAEILAQLNVVDYVLLLPELTKHDDYYKLVQDIKPDIIAITQGDSYLDKKREQASQVGAKLIEIPRTNTPSTSQLIKLLNLEID
jgi:rfaE bifunctional protein nucleotidyltransferase chain/domain